MCLELGYYLAFFHPLGVEPSAFVFGYLYFYLSPTHQEIDLNTIYTMRYIILQAFAVTFLPCAYSFQSFGTLHHRHLLTCPSAHNSKIHRQQCLTTIRMSDSESIDDIQLPEFDNGVIMPEGGLGSPCVIKVRCHHFLFYLSK